MTPDDQAVALPVQFSNYYSNSDSRTCRASPDEARHTDFDLKPSLRKRSPPSLRDGASAGEVGVRRREPSPVNNFLSVS
jgi:hypothetical protein